ncbi:hypothetical protein R1T15_06725 [Mucilaginibacter sp. L3T2-6]|nr:hypothetical protein [Mucilaginibacter sp. L3T2-6]
MDIYQNFFDRYNRGQGPVYISGRIQDEFAEMFDDVDDRNNCLFALALAQWETKSLNSALFGQVKEIITGGHDFKVWKQLGADEQVLEQRSRVLNEFLTKISVPKGKAKRRVKQKFQFETILLTEQIAPDKKKSFAVKEEYTNKKYLHTSGIMSWATGGSGIMYFTKQGSPISAKWLDSQTLEITHDKDIVFTKRESRTYYLGDDIEIIYVER